jgi:hypothetical protein
MTRAARLAWKLEQRGDTELLPQVILAPTHKKFGEGERRAALAGVLGCFSEKTVSQMPRVWKKRKSQIVDSDSDKDDNIAEGCFFRVNDTVLKTAGSGPVTITVGELSHRPINKTAAAGTSPEQPRCKHSTELKKSPTNFEYNLGTTSSKGSVSSSTNQFDGPHKLLFRSDIALQQQRRRAEQGISAVHDITGNTVCVRRSQSPQVLQPGPSSPTTYAGNNCARRPVDQWHSGSHSRSDSHSRARRRSRSSSLSHTRSRPRSRSSSRSRRCPSFDQPCNRSRQLGDPHSRVGDFDDSRLPEKRFGVECGERGQNNGRRGSHSFSQQNGSQFSHLDSEPVVTLRDMQEQIRIKLENGQVCDLDSLASLSNNNGTNSVKKVIVDNICFPQRRLDQNMDENRRNYACQPVAQESLSSYGTQKETPTHNSLKQRSRRKRKNQIDSEDDYEVGHEAYDDGLT